MNIFNMHLLNVFRRSVFRLAVQNGPKRELYLKPSNVIICRRLILSAWLNKDASPCDTEKLDLDGWKHVVQSAMPEEMNERKESEEDPKLAAAREFFETLRLWGRDVPENITEEQLKALAECPTKSSKRKYLNYLAKKELMKKARKEKKEKRKEAKKELMQNANDNKDSEVKNTFLLKFWSRSEDAIYNWRAAQSMTFGQPLVFDMDYESYMSNRELQNAVKQMLECEGANRKSKDPFHLHYCSLKEDGSYMKQFIKCYGEAWEKLLVTVTEKPHFEIFPRDQLVYLTSDSPNIMKTFEHDKIYIIGCLVDKSIQTGISLGRAKRLNLSTARLPLDEYLDWEGGAKVLTLDQMINILLTLKDTGDWKQALQFVPQRKHSGFVEIDSYSKQQVDSWKKTNLYRRKDSQEKSYNSLRRVQHKKWWEDVF
uniref:tRNA methyltransferase 10 homolog C n=1 Tax=Salvator merianae TaxID=96440 RepID=A0A8D0BAL9_SALMN